VPNSRMVIKGRGLGDSQLRQRVSKIFAAQGVSEGRLELFDYLRDKQSHLSLFGKIDIMLDSFPYSGATTVCEALWMGVPSVTIAGDKYVSRMATGILNVVGADELVADNEQAYLELARSLAATPEKITTYRKTLRQRTATSPLTDQKVFVTAMENAIRQMWCNWCDEGTRHG